MQVLGKRILGWIVCQTGADCELGEGLLSGFARRVILDDGGDLWEIQPSRGHVGAQQQPSLAAGELQKDMRAHALHIHPRTPVAFCMAFYVGTVPRGQAGCFASVSLRLWQHAQCRTSRPVSPLPVSLKHMAEGMRDVS